MNVYTGEWIKDCSVSVKGKWIANVGETALDAVGPQTKVIDASGQMVIPGLIEGHTHLAWISCSSEFLRYAIVGGTTTIITETTETFPICGYQGVVEFMDTFRNQPIKVFGTAPAMASTSRSAYGVDIGTLRKLLSRSDIIGLGESFWQSVLQDPKIMLPEMAEALKIGKPLEGHTAGAKGNKLAAYAATGVSSCHEPITAEEVLERLRLGFYVMIREGSIRRDLKAIAKIKDMGVDLRRLILVTDGVTPKDLIEKGYLEFVVQKAIDCGFDPVQAIQMVTLNVAEHFALDDIMGGIAPGKYADLLIIPEPRRIKAQYVISKGQVVAQDGNLLAALHPRVFSASCFRTVRLPHQMIPADFEIKTDDDLPTVKCRVIEMVSDLVTTELHMDVPVIQGRIQCAPDQDLLKVAAIDRCNQVGKMYVGLIKGFGLRSGAMACSAAWDTSDVIVVGADDADMALAVNRIQDLQGGAVVCSGGAVQAELALPVFGFLSESPMEILAQEMETIKQAASDLGVAFPDPFLSLVALTGAAIPYLRICEEGLVNLKDGKTLELIVGSG